MDKGKMISIIKVGMVVANIALLIVGNKIADIEHGDMIAKEVKKYMEGHN